MSKWRDPTRYKHVKEWTNLILRCNFVSRRLCREFALRIKHDKQNVKVRSRGAVGALWRRTEAEARSIVQIAYDGGGGVEHCVDCGGRRRRRSVHWAGGQRRSTMRSSGGWRRRRRASCRSSSKPWHASLDTCMHSNTHDHDPEGIGYHFMGIGQYLNTYSDWNPVTHKMNQLHLWDTLWSIN